MEAVNHIWDQVKENHRKLDSCERHDFCIDLNPIRVMGKKWKCAHCEGVVDSICKSWYETGLKHGVDNYKR